MRVSRNTHIGRTNFCKKKRDVETIIWTAIDVQLELMSKRKKKELSPMRILTSNRHIDTRNQTKGDPIRDKKLHAAKN